MTALRTTRVDFAGAVHSEWIKFHGLLSNLVLSTFTFVLITANSVLMPWAYVLRDRSSVRADYDPYPEMIVDKVGYIGLLVAVLGALVICSEYRSGQVKTTLISVPTRTPAIIAKSAVVALVSFLIGIMSAGIGFALAPAILATGDYQYELSAGDSVRLILGSGVYLATISVLGVALGTIIRSTVGSVLTVIGLLVVAPIVPQIFSEYGGDIKRFFPIEAGSLLLAPPGSDAPGPWGGYFVLAGWAVVALTIALIVVKRRDA